MFIILVPFLAAFIYLIARGKKMGQRAMQRLCVGAGGAGRVHP